MPRSIIFKEIENLEKILQTCKHFGSRKTTEVIQTEIDILRGCLYANLSE